MADQTYNLTQTGAEVQAIINDANSVKGAGATTSLTTDYIMLKDTSGAYHKIQKSSFTEAVRNTLASLLVNNDKGTTISQIAAIASGDFGSVTPANLASVLGGVIPKGEADSNWNNIVAPGTYNVKNGNSATGAPTGAYQWGTLVVMSTAYDGSTKGIVQIYCENETAGGAVWMRNEWLLTQGFRPWRRCDNFGYNTLSGLASALGANGPIHYNPGWQSMDDCPLGTTAIYQIPSTSAPSDSPLAGTLFIKYEYYNENIGLMTLFNGSIEKYMIRIHVGTGWSSWKEL
jgi:hypothetical protein